MNKRVSKNNPSAFYLNRWIQLAAFSLVLCTNNMLWITFSPIAERVVKEYDLTYSQVTWLSLIFMVLYAVTIYPAFKVSERSTAKPIYICAVLQAIGALLRAGAITPELSWLLFLGQVLAALAQPFAMCLPPKIAAQWFLPKQREVADALGCMAAPTGVIVGFVITPLADLPPTAGFFKSTLFVQAVIAVVVAVMAVGICRDASHAQTQGEICLNDKSPGSTDPTDPPLSKSGGSSDEPHSLEIAGADGCATNEVAHDKIRLSTWDGLKYVLGKKSIILVILNFGFAQGTFSCLATLIVKLFPKYNEDETSVFAALTIIGGFVGSGIIAYILGKTHAFKPIMGACYAIAVVLTIIIIVTQPYTIAPVIMVICFLLGLAVVPNMMVANELSVEMTYMHTNEAMVAGLCVMTAQIIAITQTLSITALLHAGYLETAGWGIILGCFALAVVFTLFIRVETNRLDAERSLLKSDNATNI